MKSISTLSLAPVLLALSHAPLTAQLWTPFSPTTIPTARSEHILVYGPTGASPAARGAVMFGGTDYTMSAQLFFGDTWTFNGQSWSQRNPATSPPPRHSHAAAFDSRRNVIVMFGGWTAAGILNDTWTWDGNNWSQLSPTNSPPPLVGAAMAYDSLRDRVVLVGGQVNGGPTTSATWEFDGTDWTQATPLASPGSRAYHALAYDANRGVCVTAGGATTATVYEYDGTIWQGVGSLPNTALTGGPAFAYDSVRERTILFGGVGAFTGQWLRQTWEWDGATWSNIAAGSPPISAMDVGMTFLPEIASVVTFGGQARVIGGGTITSNLTDGYGPATPVAAMASGGLSLPGCLTPPGPSGDFAQLPYVGLELIQHVGGFVPGTVPVMHWGSVNPGAPDLALIGAPGCFFWQTQVFFVFPMAAANAQGVSEHRLTMPASPGFAGLNFTLQALAVQPGVNPLGVQFADARVMTVGML